MLTQDISVAPASPGEQGVSFSAPSKRTCGESVGCFLGYFQVNERTFL